MIKDLIEKLTGQSEGCEEKCIDLKTMQFEAKEGEIKLKNGPWTYWFKSDPKKPNDPKVVWAAKQFCKMAGIPFSFFHKNPELMKERMVECWVPTLKPEKSQVLAKLRKNKEQSEYTIRALLPVEYTNISNLDVIQSVAQAVNDDYKVEFVIGDERDDLILHVRFISDETFDICGDKCAVGFSVMASELGASNLTIDTMLFRDSTKTALVASYNLTEPYFDYEYVKMQPDDLRDLFPNLVSRLKGQLTELRLKVQSAKEATEDKADIQGILKDLRLRKGLNDKFHTLLYQEIENDKEIKTKWDLAHKIALVAKNFDVANRVNMERVAGSLAGISFAKV